MKEIVEKTKKNIISFAKEKCRYSKKISDSEINALFMGLVKIVKRSAEEEISNELKQECCMSTENFRQSLVELNNIQMELKKERNLRQELMLKIESQQQQICILVKKLCKYKVTNPL